MVKWRKLWTTRCVFSSMNSVGDTESLIDSKLHVHRPEVMECELVGVTQHCIDNMSSSTVYRCTYRLFLGQRFDENDLRKFFRQECKISDVDFVDLPNAFKMLVEQVSVQM